MLQLNGDPGRLIFATSKGAVPSSKKKSGSSKITPAWRVGIALASAALLAGGVINPATLEMLNSVISVL